METKNMLTKGLVNHADESSKLVSLLALAAGAAVMPQTTNANIILSDMTDNPVTVDPNMSSFVLTNIVPLGMAQVGFNLRAQLGNGPASSSSFFITGGSGKGYVGVKANVRYGTPFVAQNPKGATWNQIAGGAYQAVVLGWITSMGAQEQAPFNNAYMAFEFEDTTKGYVVRYGWVELSMGYTGGAYSEPSVTIFRYAYDDTGARIGMGATPPVPEPASASLLALGALALGAKGLRAWRRNRPS